MITNRKTLFGLLLISALVSVMLATVGNADLPALLLGKGTGAAPLVPTNTPKPSRTPTRTPTGAGATNTPSTTPTPTATPVDSPTATVVPTTQTPDFTATLSETPGEPPTVVPTYTPWPGAPLCPDVGLAHDNTTFHTLWNAALGCHYDHEHGASPFTAQVDSAFPGFDLISLTGGNQIGHTNPSSSMENTHKHGGFKWDVVVPAPQGCVLGFEGAAAGVDAAVIQYHNFGDYSIEFESRVHSALLLARLCRPNTDPGYIYTVQHIDYGQRVSCYQGTVLQYPDTPLPAYGSGFGPYFTVDSYGAGGCRTSLAQVLSLNINANSIWTSKRTGNSQTVGSTLFQLLFRIRDTYQMLAFPDQTYPFTFGWLCSSDGGATYAALAGCRYNNSTSTVHEVAGVIPAAWDNLAGFDTDPEVGRVTGDGYTTRFGELALECVAPDVDCHPLKLVRAFVGLYGAELSAAKVANPNPVDTPERDVYWCSGLPCTETSAGAVSSGWIGSEN